MRGLVSTLGAGDFAGKFRRVGRRHPLPPLPREKQRPIRHSGLANPNRSVHELRRPKQARGTEQRNIAGG